MSEVLQLKEGETAEIDPMNGKWKAVPQVPNTDSRLMQPLPWLARDREEGGCITLYSVSKKSIMSFWGGDTRHPKDYEWCTAAQMARHAEYTEHAVNAFPMLMTALEGAYNCDDMPEDAIKIIEAVMEKCYREEAPVYAK